MPSRALRVLADVFGHASFREGQQEVVRAILEGRDVLAVLPTGTGKSLCYQLPACLLEGLVVVVSPLVALMRDQVEGLSRRGIAAAALHGGLSDEGRRDVLAATAAGRLRLLYLAPERLQQDEVMGVLKRRGVALLAVDEAHCVSTWGHDFRPAYRHLGAAAHHLAPGVRVALTATATPQAAREMMSSLGLRRPFVHVGGFFRPNLRVGVRWVGDGHRLAAVRACLNDGPAIVYAATRAQVEAVGANLGAPVYHAGLPHDVRARVQDDFVYGRSPVIVATNAFGLGVDKPDVRAVVHVQMPGSLEAYVQEMGRAGRDGQVSRCTLLYGRGDDEVQRALVERACPEGGLAERLVGEAANGRLRVSRLHDVPGLGPRQRAQAERALQALLLLGALRVEDFGRVQVVAENLDVLPRMRTHRLRRLQMLRRMSLFVRQTRGCRQATMLRYFGQQVDADGCQACDLCEGT